MKYEIKNDGYRALSCQGASGLEIIHPRTKRVIKLNGEMPKRIEAGMLATGKAEVKKVPDDTELTPEYVAGQEKPKPKPTESDVEAAKEKALADMKERADALGLPYGKGIGIDTLTTRVEGAEKIAADAEKAFAELKVKAAHAGVEVADDDTFETLTVKLEKAQS